MRNPQRTVRLGSVGNYPEPDTRGIFEETRNYIEQIVTGEKIVLKIFRYLLLQPCQASQLVHPRRLTESSNHALRV